MSILQDLQSAMQEDSIKGELAAQLHDITEQYNEGILTAEEYKELIQDIEAIHQANNLANDEETSRWLTETAKILVSLV